MDAFKLHKETEGKVHEALYINLSLLSGFYPTTKEFDVIFRKDMFVKSNKVAFFEVIHYLLHILNPDLTKKHLSSWPPYDLKRDAKFRSELIAYINTLNSTYESADIPTCQASSLICPGGFRFAKFMLKISQLVVFEHHRKWDQYSLLYPIKPHRNLTAITNVQRCHLEKGTKLIEKEAKELLQNFYKNYLDTNEKGKELQKKLKQLNKDIYSRKKCLEDTRLEFNLKSPSSPTLTGLPEKIIAIKQQIDKVVELDNLFCSSEKLLKYLSGSTMTLDHNEEHFTVPSDIAHIVTDRKELNLCQFFQGLALLLEKKALQLQSPTETCIVQTKEALVTQSAKARITLKHLESEQDHINKILVDLRDALQHVARGME